MALYGRLTLPMSGKPKDGKWPIWGKMVLFKGKYKLTVRRQISVCVLLCQGPSALMLSATASTWPPAVRTAAPTGAPRVSADFTEQYQK